MELLECWNVLWASYNWIKLNLVTESVSHVVWRSTWHWSCVRGPPRPSWLWAQPCPELQFTYLKTLHNFLESSKITWIRQRPGHGAQDRIELDGNVAAPGPMTHPWTKFTSLGALRFSIFFCFFLHQIQIRKGKNTAKTKIITKGQSEVSF